MSLSILSRGEPLGHPRSSHMLLVLSSVCVSTMSASWIPRKMTFTQRKTSERKSTKPDSLFSKQRRSSVTTMVVFRSVPVRCPNGECNSLVSSNEVCSMFVGPFAPTRHCLFSFALCSPMRNLNCTTNYHSIMVMPSVTSSQLRASLDHCRSNERSPSTVLSTDRLWPCPLYIGWENQS